jgi:hypothetical protein
VLEDDGTIAGEVLVESDTFMRQAQQPGEPAFAILDRLAADVLAVYFQKIERTQDRARISAVTADQLEQSKPVIVAHDGLAIDDTGSDGQRLDCFRRERKAIREVVAIAGEQADAAPAPVRGMRKPSCLIS